MNIRNLVTLVIVLTSLINSVNADYLIKDGRIKGSLKKNFNPAYRYGVTDPFYRERKLPYQRDPDYTSFGSDRSYRDPTNRDMGNNR